MTRIFTDIVHLVHWKILIVDQVDVDAPEELENRNQNANLLRLVYAYRSHGHKESNLDPLNMIPQL